MGKAGEKVNPGRKRARFTKEFKPEAVKPLEAGQKPATQMFTPMTRGIGLRFPPNQFYFAGGIQIKRTGSSSRCGPKGI
ncbi:MAG: hypothetical protein MN733_00175 [Nitrososphaera sp.]|nr:hypothetical protein [Nitrososphaera sp.]